MNGKKVLKLKGVVEDTWDKYDKTGGIEIGGVDVASKVESMNFIPPVTVGIGDEHFDADDFIAYGAHGAWSEWTPGDPASFRFGNHDMLEILHRYEGKEITFIMSEGPVDLGEVMKL